jgi:hypothetical protein
MTKRVDLQVSDENVSSCRGALRTLERNLPALIETMERYPVVCSFGRSQYVLNDRSDIDLLISELRAKLKDFEANKRKTGGSRISGIHATV